jgi:hypothetical protein
MIEKRIPTFEAHLDEPKKFFIETKDGETIPVRLLRATVTITTAYGDKVMFAKSNRGRTVLDCRPERVLSRDDWGNTVVKLRAKRIPEDECVSEMGRLLDSTWEGQRAWQMLNV